MKGHEDMHLAASNKKSKTEDQSSPSTPYTSQHSHFFAQQARGVDFAILLLVVFACITLP
jgi:hypothetical protein